MVVVGGRSRQNSHERRPIVRCQVGCIRQFRGSLPSSALGGTNWLHRSRIPQEHAVMLGIVVASEYGKTQLGTIENLLPGET